MKRLVAFIGGLLVLPAFAEVAPSYFYADYAEFQDAQMYPGDEYYDAEYDDIVDADDATAQPAPAVTVPTAARNATTGRTTATSGRVTPSSATTNSGRNVNTRGTASRNTVSRGTTSRAATTTAAGTTRAATTTRSATTRNTASGAATRATRSVTTTTGRTGLGTQQSAAMAPTPRTGTKSSGATTARAGLTQTDTVNAPLYNARVSTRTSGNIQARVPTIRAGTTALSIGTETSTATSVDDLDELAQLTDYCKAQYTACMDGYCNVLDDAQGRCSCSVNLKKYAATETALAEITSQLQEIAQQISYLGLSKEQITTIFSQTEAELAMQSTTDNTKIKSQLDKLQKSIISPETGKATSSSVGGMQMDMSGLFSDLSFSSTGFDFSAFGTFGTSGTSSIGNQRGEQLYKTATQRCKASVLNACQNQGVDIAMITNAYDLEIDKQCIIYERSLNEANTEMKQTISNANAVLRRARLAVDGQKNLYSLRDCVTELDNCMQDDFVCGDEYQNCLDPTGKYIVNGEVVVGSQPGEPAQATGGLYDTWVYGTNNSAWDASTSGGNLAGYIESYLWTNNTVGSSTSNSKMAAFLQSKMGYIDSNGKAQGMCAYVLNSCQDVTYSSEGTRARNGRTYDPANKVVVNYLQRTLTQIKAAQDTLLAEYAEDCISDVAVCLTQNNSNYYNWGNNYNYSTDSISGVAISACKAQITTCKSVTGYSKDVSDAAWIEQVFSTNASSDIGVYKILQCASTGGTPVLTNGKFASCTCDGGLKKDGDVCACNVDESTHVSGGTAPTCTCAANYTWDGEQHQCTAN